MIIPGAIRERIRPKSIFKFVNPEFPNYDHYHICVLVVEDDQEVLFSVCTTNKDRLERFIARRNLSEKTIVYIRPDDTFSEDTFINCNDKNIRTVLEVEEMYNRGLLTYLGEISDSQFEQILLGMLDSTMIEAIYQEHAREVYEKLFN